MARTALLARARASRWGLRGRGPRGWDAVAGEVLGDGEDAQAAQELGEDADDERGCGRVGFEAVEAFAVGGLGRVGVWPQVTESVAVWWSAAEVAAFGEGLGSHGGVDADLDAVAFALGHAAEDRHDQVVGLVVRVDGPTDFRDPQGDAVVGEEREGIAELGSVEGALGFADHHRVEAAVWVGERGEQVGCVRAPLPRQGTRLADVEVLGGDQPSGRFDEALGAPELPLAGGFGVLMVLGGDPPVEGELRSRSQVSVIGGLYGGVRWGWGEPGERGLVSGHGRGAFCWW